jgi:DNA-binding CsgD family transcriptional regulator
VPQPFDLGRTLLVKGEVERRAKQKRAARAALEQALGLFQTLGAPLWAQRAQEDLARVSGAALPPGELTPTEQRIAQLVGEGRKNREVAEALFISVKTVEANLSRIFTSSGFVLALNSPAGSPPPTARGFPPIPHRSTEPSLLPRTRPNRPERGVGGDMQPAAATAQLSMARSGDASSSWRPWCPPWWEAWSPWPGARRRPNRASARCAPRHLRRIHRAGSSSPSRSGAGSASITVPPWQRNPSGSLGRRRTPSRGPRAIHRVAVTRRTRRPWPTRSTAPAGADPTHRGDQPGRLGALAEHPEGELEPLVGVDQRRRSRPAGLDRHPLGDSVAVRCN